MSITQIKPEGLSSEVTSNIASAAAALVPKGEKGDIGVKGDKGIDGTIGVNGDKGDKGDTGAGTKGDKGEVGPYNTFDVTLDTFTGNGASNSYTLSVTPTNEDHTIAVVDGVVQLKTSYSITGNTISFGANLASNSVLEVTTIAGGAKGEKGTDGTAGAKGDKGTDGTSGTKGDKGDTGTAGDKGADGAAGSKGDKGDAGPTGGSNTQVLFNDSGSANGSAALTFNKSSNTITVGGSIVPNANVTYDLGSSNMRFKDLYLSGNTINLGGATLSISNNVLVVNSGGVSTSVNTPRYITVVQTGSLTAPVTSNTRYYPPASINLTKVYATVGTAPSGNFSFILKKNGSSIGTFTIASGNYKLTPNTISTSMTANDYLTMEVSSGTSSELQVEIEYLLV